MNEITLAFNRRLLRQREHVFSGPRRTHGSEARVESSPELCLSRARAIASLNSRLFNNKWDHNNPLSSVLGKIKKTKHIGLRGNCAVVQISVGWSTASKLRAWSLVPGPWRVPAEASSCPHPLRSPGREMGAESPSPRPLGGSAKPAAVAPWDSLLFRRVLLHKGPNYFSSATAGGPSAGQPRASFSRWGGTPTPRLRDHRES